MPMMNMNTEPSVKFRSLKMRRSMNGLLGRQRVDDEHPEAGDHQAELDPGLGRLEPAIVGAAVEHQLQRADAERQHAEAEEVEAADLDLGFGHVEQQHGRRERCRPAG